MLLLKLQNFDYLTGGADSLEKTLMQEKIKGSWRRGWQRMSWLTSSNQWTRVWANSGRQWRTGMPGMLQSMGLERVRYDWMIEQQQQHKRKRNQGWIQNFWTQHISHEQFIRIVKDSSWWKTTLSIAEREQNTNFWVWEVGYLDEWRRRKFFLKTKMALGLKLKRHFNGGELSEGKNPEDRITSPQDISV